MAWLRTNRPPEYNNDLGYEGNFTPFFEWASELRRPLKQIPEGDDFHSIESHDGLATVFAKTPTMGGQDGRSLVLLPPGHTPPPLQY